MATIEIIPTGIGSFQVEITDEEGTSTHTVNVPDGYLDELGVADATMKDVVHESIRFLLEREPRQQIMNEFALPVISRYFPEYPDELPRRVARGEPGEHAG